MQNIQRLLIATLCTLTLVITIPLQAKATSATNPFIDPTNNSRGNLIFDQNKTLASYPAPKGSLFRTAYTFADGSVGIFATDNTERPSPPASNGNDMPRENLWVTPPNDTLLRFDGNGTFLDQLKIPTMVEHPYQSRGPVNIVRNNEGQYWGIRQGIMVDSIATPHGTAVRDLTSHEIVRFDSAGDVKIVDVQSFFPDQQNSFIVFNLTLSGETLFVNAGGGPDNYILALDARNGTLLYKSKYPDNLRGQLIPWKDGKVGLYKYDTAEMIIFSTPLPEILSTDKVEQQIRIGDLSNQLTSYGNPSLSILASGEFANINYGLASILDNNLQSVRNQTLLNLMGTAECVNCPHYSFPYLLSSNRRMVISESEIQVQELHPMRAILNGKLLLTDSPVYYDADDGHVWVPLRTAAEAIGAVVGYDREKRLITLQLNDKTVTIHQDKPEIEMKTMIYYSKTYVGVRALSELLGINVNWNQETYTVELGSQTK